MIEREHPETECGAVGATSDRPANQIQDTLVEPTSCEPAERVKSGEDHETGQEGSEARPASDEAQGATGSVRHGEQE